MKKLIALLLALVMALPMAACSTSGSDSGDSASATYETGSVDMSAVSTVTEGKLTVATSPDFAPMEFVDATQTGQDKYVGFDMILARYLADSMGLELEIVPMSFEACQTAVSMGTVDMAMSGFSWKEDRALNYNLSDYYNAGGNEDAQTLIALAENADKYNTAEDLAGVKVGVQTASLQESLAGEQLPDSELVVVSDLTTALMQLRNGDFDVLAVAEGNGLAIIANNEDIAQTGFYFEVDEKYTGNVILMQKGNDALTEAVNTLMAQAEAAGYYDSWYAAAKATAGIEVAYDDDGNEITESTEG